MFIAPALPSFIRNDIDLLSSRFRVIVNHYDWSKKLLTPVFMFRQLFFILWHLAEIKLMIVSFGGYWAFIPSLIGKISGKPVYIILHGTDCASIPSLHYGSLRKPLLKMICRASYRMSSCLLPVSDSLIRTRNTYYQDEESSDQGYRYFFPSVSTPEIVLNNGVDVAFWNQEDPTVKEPNSFIAVLTEEQFILKGGDLITVVAGKFPECNFYLVGLDSPPDNSDIPGNITFLSRLRPEELRRYYQKSQFHFQLSIFEGFGIALCEAMLCHCIPIGSGVNMIPEIIGDTGFILEKRDINLLEALMREALSAPDKTQRGKMARQRIVDNYSLEKRRKELFSLLGKK